MQRHISGASSPLARAASTSRVSLRCTSKVYFQEVHMMVDVHSHFFRYPEHFSKDFAEQAKRARNQEIDLTVRWEEYHAGARECDKTIVFGGKAALAGLWVPDKELAEYARQHADKVIGFLSVDPTQAGWQDEL